MSTIYISEPPTSGKVIIKTSCGEIEIELWSKEAPVACRNFVQLCMEGYYDNTIFHRVVKKFIIQGGDPDGTGDGGESIYGKPFKMEVHSRLRFNRRGLVAMHCTNGEVAGSQFFFTLNKTPELQNNYTIFGTVVGDTVFNLMTMAEGLVDKETERPHDPQRILSATVIVNPFNDIIPRQAKKTEAPKREVPAVKDFGLLSFMHDEDDDDEDLQMNFRSKTKSAHDYAKNANLSSESVKIYPEDFRPAEIIDLAPAIIEDKSESDDKKEEIKRIKLENRQLELELARQRLKDLNQEKKRQADFENSENLASDSEQAKEPLEVLHEFSRRLKNGGPGDWFYHAVTGAENDEVEVRVHDPDVYNPEKYDLHDPRNPLNQRKRQADEPPSGPAAAKRK